MATEPSWAEIRAGVLKDVVLAFDSLEIPALPHAVTQFIERSVDPDVSNRELASIIETDSGLTFELLKNANSASSSLRRPIRDVGHALTHLGMKQAKILLITAGTKAASRSSQSKLIHHENFWNESFQKALFAKEIARLLGLDKELAFSSALLADFLLPAATNRSPGDYIEYLKPASRTTWASLVEFEQQRFNWNHASVGAAVAHQWNLPDDIVCCIYFHHRMETILADEQLTGSAALPVALSACLPDQICQTPGGRERLIDLNSKWSRFDLQAVCRAVDAHVEERSDVCSIRFPLMKVFEGAFRMEPALAKG